MVIAGATIADAATSTTTATCMLSDDGTNAVTTCPSSRVTTTITAPGPTTTVTVTPAPVSSTPSSTDPAPSTSAPGAPDVLEQLDTAAPAGFSKSVESASGRSTITPGADGGVQFYSPAGDRRVELASGHAYGEGDTIWVQQDTVLPIPWPLADPDTNFMNWVAADSSGYGADIQVASQSSNGQNRLHAWLYPLGSATRTGAMNWKAALIYDAPLPAGEIDVTLGLTLSSDPTKGRYELWINGAKVASGTGRTMFTGSRVYGKFGIYGGPSKSDRSVIVTLWQVTSTRPF